MFTNSHCPPEQQTEIVSRADIFSDRAHFKADSDKLAELDELLKANLGSFDVLQTRKRHGSVEGCPPACPAFRLVSAAQPLKVISLEARPLPERTIWEPPCEDTDQEAKLRKQQALSAAVDLRTLFESAQTYVNLPPRMGKLVRAHADVPLSPLNLFLAELPHKENRALRMSHDRNSRPSPHEVVLKGDTLPVIALKSQQEPTTRPKRKRNRRRWSKKRQKRRDGLQHNSNEGVSSYLRLG